MSDFPTTSIELSCLTLLLFSFYSSTEASVEPHGKKLCKKCIVGKTVPVLREASDDDDGGWQMCEVEEHDDEDNKYIVLVGEDVKEKVTISTSPFADYIDHYRKEQPATSNSKFTAMLLQDMFSDEAPQYTKSDLYKTSGFPKYSGEILCNDETDPTDWTLDSVIKSSKSSPMRVPIPSTLSTKKPPATNLISGKTNNAKSSTAKEASGKPFPNVKTPPRTPKRKRETTPKKALPRSWSASDDKKLIQLVAKGSQPTKWSDMAQMMTERSGKQCRERYLNHLKPKLRFEEWTPEEDVQLCELYHGMGSKWAIMAKIIKGRTDNNIKNRFHHIRRRLDKDVARIVKSRKIDEVASLIHIGAICRTPHRSENNNEFAMKSRQILPYLAADSVKENINRTQFGPFVPAKGDLCQRCNFVVPSIQTGRLVSRKTGWCESCTKIPPYIVGDMLRQCLHLRKERP